MAHCAIAKITILHKRVIFRTSYAVRKTGQIPSMHRLRSVLMTYGMQRSTVVGVTLARVVRNLWRMPCRHRYRQFVLPPVLLPLRRVVVRSPPKAITCFFLAVIAACTGMVSSKLGVLRWQMAACQIVLNGLRRFSCSSVSLQRATIAASTYHQHRV